MTSAELEHLYFEWLYRLVCDDRYSGGDRTSYRRLLSYLHSEPFRYENKHPRDEARAYDGIDLRYEFGYRSHIDQRLIAQELDIRKCSMLEMMIGLCFRYENIAADPMQGDRIGQWFWAMLCNLGLAGMNDRDYDQQLAEDILDKFQDNDYSANGEGGLFVLRNYDGDVRDQELYWQMCRFMNENPY